MKIVLAAGTRPEKIKMEPVAHALAERGAEVAWFETVQSPDLVTGTRAQGVSWMTLQHGIGSVLTSFKTWAEQHHPDAVLVQGDTATAFSVALAAFLQRLPVGHVEAGLRTYKDEPYPEEAFRRMIAPLARWHFAPDEQAADNIACERGMGFGMDDRPAGVFVTGNPVIDTLPPEPFSVLVTLHRRENWGARIRNALQVLEKFSADNDRVYVQVIAHPNWHAQNLRVPKEVSRDGVLRWMVLDPQPPERFRVMIRNASAIVTDSGGLQEEAAYYGKTCLVVRGCTERESLRRSGAIRLCHPDRPEELSEALGAELAKRTAYGTGDAGRRIADILMRELSANAD